MEFYNNYKVVPINHNLLINLADKSYPTIYTFSLEKKLEKKDLEIKNWQFNMTAVCQLDNGLILTTHMEDICRTRGAYDHFGYVNILKERDGKYISINKIFFSEEFVTDIHKLDNNLALVICEYTVYILYPNSGCELSEDVEWHAVQIFNRPVYTTKVLKNQVILFSIRDMLKIFVPQYDTNLTTFVNLESSMFKFHIEDIYGFQNYIVKLDQLCDNRIVSVDTKGNIQIWGKTF